MTSSFRFADFELRTEQRLLLQHGQPLQTGARALDLLIVLAEQRHRVVSKHELLDHCWPDQAVEPNNLAVQVWALRRLLGPGAITTVAGRGYRFTAPGQPETPGAATQAMSPSLQLLLVDDHPLFRDGLALALQAGMADVAVQTCGGAQQALVLLAADPGQFDLVLIDHHLGGIESGMALAQRLRAAHPALACALMSGDEDPGLPHRARQAGLSAFLPKSLQVCELTAALHSLAQGNTWFPPMAIMVIDQNAADAGTGPPDGRRR